MSHNNLQTPAEKYKDGPYAYLFEDDLKQVAISVAPVVVEEEDEDEDNKVTILPAKVEEGGMAEALIAEGMTPKWKAKQLKEISQAITYTRMWDMVEDWGARTSAMKMIMKAAGDFQEKDDNATQKLLERIFQKALQKSSH